MTSPAENRVAEAEAEIAKLSETEKAELDMLPKELDYIMEFGNGMGGGQRVRNGAGILTGYAKALGVSRKVLVLALKRASGEAGMWGRSMTAKELREIGREAPE